MSRTQKLYDMLWYVQTKKKFTAQELADEFSLSLRSVYRYLSDLADMGLYIESKQGRYGGFQILDNQLLPPVLFLEDEIVSLFFAMSSLDDFQDFPFQLNVTAAREKLLSVIPLSLRNRLEKLSDVFQLRQPPQTVTTPFLSEIMTAALSKNRLFVTYHSQTKRSEKTLEPMGVYASNGLWYLYARDLVLNDLRYYRIDRLLSVTPLMELVENSVPLKMMETDYHPKETIKLVVELGENGVNKCLETPYLRDSLVINKDGTGYIDGRLSPSDLSYTAEFVLQLGAEAKVIEPREMIDWLLDKTNTLLKIYQ
ncbi:YafY family protein [uncultured Vagococcus sp.]|uniref:helix-turn-helix transcriptional regulator n=1 Tax=uncultured Vagococcus sp. TaxID=189676 RepID=UPI0028D56B40|nr:YafY family protein [uncultured Vagococcus sp.]